MPPTHTGSFAAASGSQSGPKAQVALNGVDVAVDVAEEVAFAITDCTQLRTHEVCYLQLHELNLNLNVEGGLKFGEYTVDMASLNLSVPFQTTTVTFSCDAQGCLGSFDFSSRVGTTLGMNMSWEQTKISTGSVGKGFLALGADGLGSLARVQGELDLDASKSSTPPNPRARCDCTAPPRTTCIAPCSSLRSTVFTASFAYPQAPGQGDPGRGLAGQPDDRRALESQNRRTQEIPPKGAFQGAPERQVRDRGLRRPVHSAGTIRQT